MRKLIVANVISLDGYYEGEGKDVFALPIDPGFDAYNRERLRSADTIVLGRTTFEQAKGYWPPIADDPAADPTEREISRLNNSLDKIVVSDSLRPDELAPWLNTRIIKRADANKQIGDLKRQLGKDIFVFGSHTLWNDLLVAGLVDEIHLMIGPALLGGGTPVFGGGTRVPLRLLDARTLDGSQLVLARYAVET